MNQTSEQDNWQTDDQYWKLGFLYFNKQDKRLLVPKRKGSIGLTVNFANPMSIFTFLILMAAIIFVSVVLQ